MEQERVEPPAAAAETLRSDPTTEQQVRVGILEDERHVREILSRFLKAEHMEPLTVKNGAVAERMAANGTADLLLVDLGLGREDGVQIIRRIRAVSAIPIIVVSGRTEIESVSCGLDAGADDYLRKPIAFEELGARIRSVMRRKVPAPEIPAVPAPMEIGRVRIDLAEHRMEGPQGIQALTERESLILSQLMRNFGHPVSRNMLSRSLLGHFWDPSNRTLDVHIANIRRKIVLAGGNEKVIRTRRNMGYQIGPATTGGANDPDGAAETGGTTDSNETAEEC